MKGCSNILYSTGSNLSVCVCGRDQTFPNNTHHFHFSECICTQFTDYKMLLRALPFEWQTLFHTSDMLHNLG